MLKAPVATKRKQHIIALAAGLFIAGAASLFWGLRSMGARVSAAKPINAWYCGLQSWQLFVAPVGSLPSVTLPSGEKAVRAHVFACGQCEGAQERDVSVGYLERAPDEYVKAADAAARPPAFVPA